MRPPEKNCYDVAVIGAGPAGCSAARMLAQKGFATVLLEKAALPRYKTCGGGLLHRAFKLLPESVEQVVERRFNSVALNFLGTERSFVVTRPEPIIHMTMRADLDGLLAREAVAAGTQVVESCLVKTVTVEERFVKIATDKGDYRAQFIIAADGVHSLTAKVLGWSALPALAPALEYEVHLAAEDFARFSKIPRFDFNAIDAGYAWVFPKRSHLSVGILSTRRVSAELQTKLKDYMELLGLTRVQSVERHGYLIPLSPRREPLARGRALLVGDAAGLADPITAEGISYAIESGQLAATALADSKLDVATAGKCYQSLMEANVLGELRAGRFLASGLYHHPRLRDLAFRFRGQKLCDFVADVVMGERSYRSALKNPSAYLKLLGLFGGK